MDKVTFRIVFLYILFGFFWIIFTDQLVAKYGETYNFTTLQSMKGFIFVIVTGAFLYKVISYYLRKVEAQKILLRSYLDGTNSIVIVIDLEGKITYLNNKASQLLCDRQEEQCYGKNFFDTFVPENERIEIKKKMQSLIDAKDDKNLSFTSPIVTGSSTITALWSCNILKDYHGKKIGLVCSLVDITSEIAHKHLAKSMFEIINQSPTAIIMTDRKGNIEYVNPRFVQITGYTFEEVKGKAPIILSAGKEVYKELWEKITRGELWRGELSDRKKNGELWYIYATIFPLRDQQTGDIINFVAFYQDITGEKKLREELFFAQKMEAIGDFTIGIVHDINNVLTCIIGYGSVLSIKSEPGSAFRTYAERIVVAAEMATALTQKLLHFARKQPPQKKVINLKELLDKLKTMLQRILREHIELRLHHEREFYIYADPVQIEQVFINLASNSRYAMPLGGIFSIETEHFYMDETFIKQNLFGEEGDYVLIKVSDTGSGMDEETKKHIFEPFYTTKEPGKGTGLGLKIVHRILEEHKGFITVESALGKGTTFYIYLPLTEPQEEEHKERHHIERNRLEGTETLLLVEDDTAVSDVIKEFINMYGYKVLTAKNGEEALLLFNEHKKDIALCIIDMVLPKKSGIDVYKEISAQKPNIKVIFISGYVSELERYKDVSGEHAVIIQKPIPPEEILKTIRELLDK